MRAFCSSFELSNDGLFAKRLTNYYGITDSEDDAMCSALSNSDKAAFYFKYPSLILPLNELDRCCFYCLDKTNHKFCSDDCYQSFINNICFVEKQRPISDTKYYNYPPELC